MIKAVIFDMDGTLLDTEKVYIPCWMQAIENFGYSITREKALNLRSLGRPYAPAYFKELFGEDFPYTDVRNERKRLIKEHVKEHGVEVKPGVDEILGFLHKKEITVAIATASELERATWLLKEAGIFDRFDKIVSAHLVEHGKPAPDVYEYACRELDLLPEECLAVEDAPNGVRSAAAAGCQVVMVPDLTEPEDEINRLLYAKVEVLSEIKRLF